MRLINFLFALPFFLTLAACGGGGGGGGEDREALDQNACDVIGSTARIINGTSCESSGPVVKLRIEATSFTGFCSGTMVAPNKVLTAGHCVLESDFVRQVPSNSITISTGNDANVLARSVAINVPFLTSDLIEISENLDPNLDPESSEFFEKFQQEILSNGLRDIAIVELDRDLTLPTLPILTGDLPESGEKFSIFGFGVTSPEGTTPTTVVFSGEMRVEENGVDNIFAIFDTEGSDTCQGDSGGPAIAITSSGQAAVIGVTSLGFNDCKPGETSVFAHTAGRAVDFLRQAASGANFL